jgi:putative transposase
MNRMGLSDAQWARVRGLVPGKETDRGVTGRDNRLFVDAVLWIVRTGAPWRDLPPELGNWNSVFRRFSRWSQAGVWESLFKALADQGLGGRSRPRIPDHRRHHRARPPARGGRKGGLKIRPSGARAAG